MKTRALIEREKTRPATGPSAVFNDAMEYVHVVYVQKKQCINIHDVCAPIHKFVGKKITDAAMSQNPEAVKKSWTQEYERANTP